MRKPFVAAVVAAAAAAAPASASAAVSVAVGTPQLTARVSVAVPVDVTCDFQGETFDNVAVSISQAVGKEIAHGSATVYGAQPPSMFASPLLYPCDGLPHTVTVTVPAATDGPPFKRNADAVITASALVEGFGPTGFAEESGSAVAAVRLK